MEKNKSIDVKKKIGIATLAVIITGVGFFGSHESDKCRND